MRVLAVERIENSAPVEAIVVSDDDPKDFLGWWGGSAIERVDIGSPEALVHGDPKWRILEMELPSHWEEGYLQARNGDVVFVKGPVPSRTDWQVGRRPGEWWRLLLQAAMVVGALVLTADAIGDLPPSERTNAWRLSWTVLAIAFLASATSAVKRVKKESSAEKDVHEAKEKSWRMQERLAPFMLPLVGVAIVIDNFLPPLFLAAAFLGFAGMLLPLVPMGTWEAQKAGRLWRK